MYIKEVNVKNFRSILDESLPCDSLTALVGRNGSGKSSFLSALDLFYNPSASITPADFYSEDTTQDIEITVSFGGLSNEAKEFFSAYIDNELMTIVRVFTLTPGKSSGTYHGMRLQNPDFGEIKNAGGARDIRAKYNEIKAKEEYENLPAANSAEAVRTALAEWESHFPERCTFLRDDGRFFGFTRVAQGYLGKFTRFIHIPAVRNAQEDATESRGAPITEIMNLIVRSALSERQELTDYKEETQNKYRQIMDPNNLTELVNLEEELSSTLKSYVPEASVLLKWSEFQEVTIPMPQAQVKLLEDGYESTVDRTGHGLQRAFIVTMLQHLVAARGSTAQTEEETLVQEENESTTESAQSLQMPSIVLAIEEPELYQHPSRQRHLASVLLKLANGTIPGVAEKTQVVYTTHSPLMVGLDRFSQIRVLRKSVREDDKPKCTQLKKADMDKVADTLWKANGSTGDKYTAETLSPRLQAIMTPWMNEGFFADKVVLVEGEDDRAAILATSASMGHDFDSLGISVIPCFGKRNLDRPLVIFRQLGIPVYVVWDGDFAGNDPRPEDNRYLLRLLNQAEEDWPNFVLCSSTCFETDLEQTLENELGKELLEMLSSKAQEELGISGKNPAVFREIVNGAYSQGKTSKTLENVVERIITLGSPSTTAS